jgi:hypothetical protein
MKKVLLALLPLALPVIAAAQFDGDPSTKPAQTNEKKAPEMAMQMPKPLKGSPELKKLNWMVGRWRMNGTANQGPQKMKVTGSSQVEWDVDGTWLTTHEKFSMGKGMPAMAGHLMISYDTMSKQYVGYWMDNMSAMAIAIKGNFTDENTMVFKSEAANGMPATTYTMARTKTGQSFEMKSEDGSMGMSLNYTKMVAKRKPAMKPKAKTAAPKPPVAAAGTTTPPVKTGTGN